MAKIFLYAEVLTHIRQVTLYASLQIAQINDETILRVVSDKKRVTVSQGGVTSSIYLPTEISYTADVTIPRGKKKEISIRLEIGATSELLRRDDVATTAEVPWSAQDLTSEAMAQCKQCNATIIEAGKVTEWKDLPSENWAEMMDFWHCHKPHDENSNGHAAEAKGYSARSQLAVTPGVGLVDTVSFLLHKSDCKGLKTPKPDPKHSTTTLQCTTCSSTLGEQDLSLDAIKLFKSRLAVQPTRSGPITTHDASIFINAQLLLSIDSLATRKFILHSPTKTNRLPSPASPTATTPSCPALHLWLFNPDIQYITSPSDTPLHRASKVFYQPLTTTDAQSLLDAHPTTLEEVILPPSILEEFKTTLAASTEILPESARAFGGEWKVGLLGRYERRPRVGGVQR